MSRRPYSTRSVILRPPLDDPDLVGAWTCEPHGNQMVDRTPAGNNGTCGTASVVEQTILGPMRRYGPNSGALPTFLGAANAFPLTDVTVEFWMRYDVGAAYTSYPVSYWQGWTDAWQFHTDNLGNIMIFDDIDNAGTNRYSTPYPRGKLLHVVGVMDNLENLLYIDGNLVGSGEFSSDTWASFAASLTHGGFSTYYWGHGIVGPLNIYSTAKSAAWVAARYREGAAAIQFRTDWGVKDSMIAEGVGWLLGFNSSPFEVVSGTHRISTEAINGVPTKVIECVTAGIVRVDEKYFFATPTEAAFGGFKFWTYKPDAATLDVNFISTSTTALGGYTLTHAADESLVIAEVGVGNVVTGGTASHSAWHEHLENRRFSGLFTPAVDGAAWGVPAADLTTTTSRGILIDMDAGCKVGYSGPSGEHGIVKYLGERDV